MNKFTWTISLVASMAGIAATYPITKALNGAVDPFMLAFLRFFIASLALLPIILYRRTLSIPRGKELGLFGLIALCAVLPTALIAISIPLTNSVVAAILINTNPLIIVLIAPFLIGEKVTSSKIVGLFIGFCGVVAVVLNGHNPFTELSSSYLWGTLILLFAALLSALNKTYSRNLVRKYDGLYVTFLGVVLGALALGAINVLRGGLSLLPEFTTNVTLSVLTIGIIGTAIPWVVWSNSLKHLDVHIAASFYLLIPVFATFYSFFFLSEQFTFWMLLGLILTSIGIYIVQRQEKITTGV